MRVNEETIRSIANHECWTVLKDYSKKLDFYELDKRVTSLEVALSRLTTQECKSLIAATRPEDV